MRKFLLSVFTLASLSMAAQTVVQPFQLREVKLLPSRFQRNMQRDSTWIASIPVGRLLHSFRNTSGLYSDREGGYDTGIALCGWESPDCDLRGHITGHLLSAMAYLQMKEKADSLVQGLAEVQRQYGTGYLSAFGEGLIDRNIQGKSVWAPFYTLHKILQGLIDQYQLCGNETALQLARGMGDWAYNKLQPLSEETRLKMIRNEFGGFNEAMYNLYAITRDDRYLWVARFFYHNDKIDPLKQGISDLGTYHANTFIPKLLGECRNYELSGAEDSRSAATLLFNTLVNHHSFVTGELSDKEHLFKPSEQSKHLTGYDGENCCTYNLLKLADRLFTYQPDSKIADYYERALYNHILGQQDTLSSMVCYFTPLMTGGYRLYSTRDSSFWCCVGSGFESHAKYQSSIYFHSDNNLYINLFIPSEVNWNGTIVRQETTFPESNKTTLTIIHPSLGEGQGVGLTLKLRYPYWATWMKVNGKRVKPGKDGYVDINSRNVRNSWSLNVEFGMTLREEATKDDPTRVALLYGPIVLGGRLAEVPHPFSDPTKHNDYYTFDYGQHPDIPLGETKHLGGLTWSMTNPQPSTINHKPITLQPLYDLQRCRYVVYWKKPDAGDKGYIRERGAQQHYSSLFDYFSCIDTVYDVRNESATEGRRAYIRLPRGHREVKAVLYCHQNMTEEVLFRNESFTRKMDSLGIAMAFVQRGSQNWDTSVKDAQGRSCQQRFEQIMNDFARGTEHPEIASAKIIPFGHSAQATFPWNFAAWNPKRTLCIISYHGDAPRTNLCGYGRENVEWGRTRNIDRIPALMIEGEYEWWEARVNPALAFRMHYPDSRISFLCDAGRGHFDLCQQTMDYMALFIEKALHYQPVSTLPTGDEQNPFVAEAADGVYYSRWFEDGHESTYPHDQFWYFDREMASLTKARYDEHKGKQRQYVSGRINGKLLRYNKDGHVKINIPCPADTFTIEPVFVNADRDALSDSHAQVKPRVVLISGPAIQIAENTFVVDRDYFGKDPKRMWTGITLSIEAEGDSRYKPAQQEMNIQIK